ncbi:hypothetical protein NP590_08270 [Methylomonas sp. SURF-2]|uniref:Uncharacterized protein n=1 Tax=Methylomonas subterranea TaxID=2952225 RepID=A0ABT1TF61_9GAMM|nr:hypothetical protein [Methylomonas sp. SURF-2]MCQ8104095.1 hypothetical protein [Methylomonas sp. SURF-2]
MNDLSKDILIGSLFISGLLSFFSGLFVISTVLFASSAIFSNMANKTRISG